MAIPEKIYRRVSYEPEILNLGLDELESKYELIYSETEHAKSYAIALKTIACAASPPPKLPLSRLLKLAANPPSFSLHFDLIKDPAFILLSQAIAKKTAPQKLAPVPEAPFLEEFFGASLPKTDPIKPQFAVGLVPFSTLSSLPSESAVPFSGGGGGTAFIKVPQKEKKDPEKLSNFRISKEPSSGLESVKTRFERAVKKASLLNKGCADHPFTHILKESYWQEKLIDTHPYGSDIYELLLPWQKSKTHFSFDTYLKIKPHLLPTAGVRYLDAEERKEFEVTLADGKVISASKAPLCTDIFKGDKKEKLAIYVLSKEEKLYIGPYRLGRFHHSSFCSGEPVIGAGEIKTNKEGTIELISSKSCHYTPTAMQLHTMLDFLESHGVNLGTIALVENNEEGFVRHPSVEHFRTSSPRSPALAYLRSSPPPGSPGGFF
jgi:hypothetical protein